MAVIIKKMNMQMKNEIDKNCVFYNMKITNKDLFADNAVI
jgi:hypothetical protein